MMASMEELTDELTFQADVSATSSSLEPEAVISLQTSSYSMPIRSSPCGTCKKRRVKCDGATPFCERCLFLGRECEGYGTSQDIDGPLLDCNNDDLDKILNVQASSSPSFDGPRPVHDSHERIAWPNAPLLGRTANSSVRLFGDSYWNVEKPGRRPGKESMALGDANLDGYSPTTNLEKHRFSNGGKLFLKSSDPFVRSALSVFESSGGEHASASGGLSSRASSDTLRTSMSCSTPTKLRRKRDSKCEDEGEVKRQAMMDLDNLEATNANVSRARKLTRIEKPSSYLSINSRSPDIKKLVERFERSLSPPSHQIYQTKRGELQPSIANTKGSLNEDSVKSPFSNVFKAALSKFEELQKPQSLRHDADIGKRQSYPGPQTSLQSNITPSMVAALPFVLASRESTGHSRSKTLTGVPSDVGSNEKRLVGNHNSIGGYVCTPDHQGPSGSGSQAHLADMVQLSSANNILAPSTFFGHIEMLGTDRAEAPRRVSSIPLRRARSLSAIELSAGKSIDHLSRAVTGIEKLTFNDGPGNLLNSLPEYMQSSSISSQTNSLVMTESATSTRAEASDCYQSQRTLLDNDLAANLARQSAEMHLKPIKREESSQNISIPATPARRTQRRKMQPQNTPKRFACPFSKHDPSRYERVFNPCTYPPGLEPRRLAEHIRRVHSAKHRGGCIWCPKKWSSSKKWAEEFETHKCPVRDDTDQLLSNPECMSAAQEEAFEKVGKAHLSTAEERWIHLFQQLFPEAFLVPSPNYDFYIINNSNESRSLLSTPSTQSLSDLSTLVKTVDDSSMLLDQFDIFAPQSISDAHPLTFTTDHGTMAFDPSGMMSNSSKDDKFSLSTSGFGAGAVFGNGVDDSLPAADFTLPSQKWFNDMTFSSELLQPSQPFHPTILSPETTTDNDSLAYMRQGLDAKPHLPSP